MKLLYFFSVSTRNNLIAKGMIFAPAHGDTDFTVPLFEDYLRRVRPD